MAKTSIRLNWVDISRTEDGFRVYRSLDPFDTNSLPAVLATLPPNSQTYVDGDVSFGETYYYMVSAFEGVVEVFSPLKQVNVREDVYFISVTGEMHTIDNTGNVFSIEQTSTRLPGIVAAQKVETDMEGNFYIMDTVGVAKYSPDFRMLWRIPCAARDGRTGFAVDLYGDLLVASSQLISDRFLQPLNPAGAALVKFRGSNGDLMSLFQTNLFNFYTTASYILDIVPTVDPNLVYIHNYNRRYRCNLRQQLVDRTSGDIHQSHRSMVVNHNFDVYLAATSRVRKDNHWLENQVTGATMNHNNYGGVVLSPDHTKVIYADNADLVKCDATTLEEELRVPTGSTIQWLQMDSAGDLFVMHTNRVRKYELETFEMLWDYVPANGGTYHYLLVPPTPTYYLSGFLSNNGTSLDTPLNPPVEPEEPSDPEDNGEE